MRSTLVKLELVIRIVVIVVHITGKHAKTTFILDFAEDSPKLDTRMNVPSPCEVRIYIGRPKVASIRKWDRGRSAQSSKCWTYFGTGANWEVQSLYG